jgi:Rieske Fe-S protein
MSQESQQVHCATRRGVLLGVGIAGVGGVLAGCSTAAVPYEANEAGTAPGEQAPAASGTQAMAGQPAAQGSGSSMGTLLAAVTDIPVGGGKIFPAEKVVVTQPTKGEIKAFSAVCTHVGCVCNVVANGTINCPCHGSEFKITNGAVVTGPAPTPLPTRTISISDNKIYLT